MLFENVINAYEGSEEIQNHVKNTHMYIDNEYITEELVFFALIMAKKITMSIILVLLYRRAGFLVDTIHPSSDMLSWTEWKGSNFHHICLEIMPRQMR